MGVRHLPPPADDHPDGARGLSIKIDITDNPDARRFEARANGTSAGFISYRLEAGQITLIHTEIQDAFDGKGVASTLVKRALGMVRDSGLVLVPVCPFVAGYLQRHPEYVDLVRTQDRARFGLPEVPGPA